MNFHPQNPRRRKQRLLIVFGTRPEALKCFPVVRAALADGRFVTKVCVTGQHRDMVDQVIELTGSRSKIIHRPLPVDDPRQRRPDISLAMRELGWRPTVDLTNGLMQTIGYFDALLTRPALELAEAI